MQYTEYHYDPKFIAAKIAGYKLSGNDLLHSAVKCKNASHLHTEIV